MMRQHIMPTWRTVPLAKITFEGLTHWISRLSLGGLGPSAIRQSVFVMSAALDHACVVDQVVIVRPDSSADSC
jgi:hypothetical protein